MSSFAPSGFFVLRTPLLPFAARPASRADLRALLARPDVRDALFVAAPSLDARLGVWERDPDSDAGRKIEQALTRYLARASGRATPFGLFAGCSVGTIGRATRLAVGGPCGRHTRLDMDYVVALADALCRDPLLQSSRFTPNTSLYRIAGQARYVEVRRDGKGWSHHRAALPVPDYLEAVLTRAGDGATPDELTRALLDHDPEATHAEAAEYVAELIDQQILVSELAPAVTGPEPIHALLEQLRQLPGGGLTAERLTAVRDELDALDAQGPGAAPEQYRNLATQLSELPAAVDVSRLFQVDLVRPDTGATLGENVVAEIVRGVELLRRLTPRSADDALIAFRQTFAARFGDTTVTREVPLAEALDDETGVGFGDSGEAVEASSLLEGLDLSPPAQRRGSWGPREMYLLGRLTEALTRGEQELALTERDVEHLAVRDPLPLPDAFAVMARLESVSGEAVARGDFRLLLTSATGPSGARLLGRFCHADPDLAARVEQHLRAEEALRPEAVFAEIIHLPEGRLGNILARPVNRTYEIPYLGRSGAPLERQLPLSDLRVSVQGTRVVLRSARLGREVLPRLTSAHNFAPSRNVYGFLCALQEQGAACGLAWDWGPLAGSAFLPRVTRGRLVLARARWCVTPAEAAALKAGQHEARFAAVQRWRQERRLPRWVCLVEADNELPIDLDNRLMVETLLGQFTGGEHATLTELFPAPDRLCAEGPDGRFVHEMLVPFVRQVDMEPTKGNLARRRAHETARRVHSPCQPVSPSPCLRVFPPGSEWLALKLYAGPIVVDQLVRDRVGPLACECVAGGAARRWFFVRYADPHHHLRLRVEGEPGRLRSEVLPRIETALAPLLADGRVWKVQLDTYEREVERYGGPAGIELCERLFHHDSEAAVAILRSLDEDSRGDRRWRLALLAMARLLDDLGLDPDEKRAVAGQVRDAFRAEFVAGGDAARRLGVKFRAEAAALSELLRPGGSSEWPAARAVLDRRSQHNRLIASLLSNHTKHGRLTSSVADIAGSLLHMLANRLLRSAHRAQEMVLYEFLHRYYQGKSNEHLENGI